MLSRADVVHPPSKNRAARGLVEVVGGIPERTPFWACTESASRGNEQGGFNGQLNLAQTKTFPRF